MGDHIVCNGLVRELIKRESPDFAYLVCQRQYHKSVSQMYSDDQRIICLPVSSITEKNSTQIYDEVYSLPQSKVSKVYRIGFQKARPDWDISFYDSVGIPFDCRWKSFRINRDLKREADLENLVNPSGQPFILVHEKNSGRTCPITIRSDSAKVIAIDWQTDCFLDWCGMIEKAKEVHCVDSGFVHLASSIRNHGVFHDFGINSHLGHRFVLRETWEKIIETSNRKVLP